MLPSLQVTVDTRGWSFVLDLRLALSQYGLTLALRLAEEVRVYLVPRLWGLLDNTSFYEGAPDYLTSDPLGCGAGSQVRMDSLRHWESARTELGVSGLKLYWPGDRLYESLLPKDLDGGFITRFERLGAALEKRFTPPADDSLEHPLLEGGRDAVALAGCMGRHRSVILSLGGGIQPPLCRFLELCGIESRALRDGEARLPQEYLAPVLVRSGAAELIWMGLPLVAIHLVVPQPYVATDAAGECGGSMEPSAELHDWWNGAVAFWYPVLWPSP